MTSLFSNRDKVIHYRPSLMEEEERAALSIGYVYTLSTEGDSSRFRGHTMLSRYSCLPFYEEYVAHIRACGNFVVNSKRMHDFCADATQWAKVLDELTIPVYETWGDLPEGAYVVKGKTNSKKFNWNTHMFAPTVGDIPSVASRLLDDSLISSQGIVVRPYVPLRKIGEGINGLPFSNEWRTFWMRGKDLIVIPTLVAIGQYWTVDGDFEGPPLSLMQEAAWRVAHRVNFFCLDFAQKDNGEWVVLEVNDGQMSGLSNINPAQFYKNLSDIPWAISHD